jgi:hypothetical protein
VGKRPTWRKITPPTTSPELEVIEAEIRRVAMTISIAQSQLEALRTRQREEKALAQDAEEEEEEETDEWEG